MPRRTVSPLARANARRLRRSMTGAEERLWAALRGHRFAGVSFRRQTPIGPYVADFFCPQARLVIEVDGGQHGEPTGIAHDRRRDAWIAAAGYRVLRFWNHDVLTEADAVLDVIWSALAEGGVIDAGAEPPLPVPPPPGGRERRPKVLASTDRPLSPGIRPAPFNSDAASGVPSPLEGEGQGGGASASPPSAEAANHTTLSSASKTGRHP